MRRLINKVIKMPYKRKGNKVYKKTNTGWKLKSRCNSAANAKAQIRLLHGVEHGWKPTGKKKSGNPHSYDLRKDPRPKDKKRKSWNSLSKSYKVKMHKKYA